MVDTRRLGDPGTAAFRVEKYPFYLLNRLVSRYNVVIEARLRTIGLDIPSWRVLMILGEGSARSIGQIAEAAVINVSTMTRIVQRMTAANLVGCSSRPDDNRITEVKLTSDGEEKLTAARAITAPIYAQVIDGFSCEDFDRLIDALEKLYRNLS